MRDYVVRITICVIKERTVVIFFVLTLLRTIRYVSLYRWTVSIIPVYFFLDLFFHFPPLDLVFLPFVTFPNLNYFLFKSTICVSLRWYRLFPLVLPSCWIVAFRSRRGISTKIAKTFPWRVLLFSSPRFCMKQEDNTAYTYTNTHAAHLYICSRGIQLRLLLILLILLLLCETCKYRWIVNITMSRKRQWTINNDTLKNELCVVFSPACPLIIQIRKKYRLEMD